MELWCLFLTLRSETTRGCTLEVDAEAEARAPASCGPSLGLRGAGNWQLATGPRQLPLPLVPSSAKCPLRVFHSSWILPWLRRIADFAGDGTNENRLTPRETVRLFDLHEAKCQSRYQPSRCSIRGKQRGSQCSDAIPLETIFGEAQVRGSDSENGGNRGNDGAESTKGSASTGNTGQTQAR